MNAFTVSIIRLFFLLMLMGPQALFGQADGGANAQPGTEEQLAGQFYTNGEWEKAANLYEGLYESKPSNFYYSQLLNCYLNLKNYKSADRLASKQSKRNPRQPSYWVDQLWILEKQDEAAKAQKGYDKIIRQIEDFDTDQIKQLANAFENRGHPELAKETYLKARKQATGAYMYNLELARLYEKEGAADKVIEEYLYLLNLDGSYYYAAIQENLQDIIAADTDGKKAELIRVKLIQEIQKNPENIMFSELLIWFLVQKKDFEAALVQARALDKRMRDQGGRVFELARLAEANDQYETARKAFMYIIEKGTSSPYYYSARREFALAAYRKLTQAGSYTPEALNELHKLLTETYQEIGRNEESVPIGIRLAHIKAFFLGTVKDAYSLLEELNTPASGLSARSGNEVKLEMAEIQLFAGEVWEATLLYSQVEKSMKGDTLGQEAKFRNAKLAYYKGDFDWAKAQLDVLKTATSKLIANDALELSMLIGDNLNFDTTGAALRMFSRSDLAFFQLNNDKALQILDSLERDFPESTLGDDLLYRRAQIYYRRGDYPKAMEQLEKLLAAYRQEILADNALILLASIYDRQLKQPEKAMELYKELFTEYSGSLYVVEARNRYRVLRGDSVQ